MIAFASVAAVALTFFMGVHTVRAGLAMVVWNIAVEQPSSVLGLVALAIWVAGLAGWVLPPRKDPVRWVRMTATSFALAYAASHLIAHRTTTPVLAVITLVAWMWFMPALVEALARAGSLGALAPGMLVGFAAQVALQTALHGLDMSMLRGIAPGLGAALLGTALLVSAYVVRAGPSGLPRSDRPFPGWGMLALGPFLALQLTLLTNLGRAQMFSGWEIALAAMPIIFGLAVGSLAQPLAHARLIQIGAAVLTLALMWPVWLKSRNGLWIIAAAQIPLAIVLASALAPSAERSPRRPHIPGALGMLLLFVLSFLFYSRYEWAALWPLMAALVVIPSVLWGRRALYVHGPGVSLVIAGIGALGIGLTVLTPTSRVAQSSVEQLSVMTYNIHMGFNSVGVPGPSAIADVLAGSEASVVALQEVGRGWTVNGGVDLAAWLRWRFPGFQFVYGPMNGDLWGNVILSRYQIRDSGSVRFPLRESRFRRGLTWALMSTAQGDLLVINAHLAHDSAADRLAQADDILKFWDNRGRTILLGDFNDGPGSPPVRKLLAAGFADALAPHGLGSTFTFPSIGPSVRLDYIFISRDLHSMAGAIHTTTASDHLPVSATIRPR